MRITPKPRLYANAWVSLVTIWRICWADKGICARAVAILMRTPTLITIMKREGCGVFCAVAAI